MFEYFNKLLQAEYYSLKASILYLCVIYLFFLNIYMHPEYYARFCCCWNIYLNIFQNIYMHPEYLLEYLHNELLEWTDGETVLWSSLLTKLLKKLEKFPDQQQG